MDTSELRFGSVQNLFLELETLPLTEPFRMHGGGGLRTRGLPTGERSDSRGSLPTKEVLPLGGLPRGIYPQGFPYRGLCLQGVYTIPQY